MKFIVEDRDIEEVQAVLCDFYGIILTDDQAEEILEDNPHVAVELMDTGSFDTEGRYLLLDAVVDVVMGDLHKQGRTWHWPERGDKEEYTNAFLVLFKARAEAAKIQLSDNFVDDNK